MLTEWHTIFLIFCAPAPIYRPYPRLSRTTTHLQIHPTLPIPLQNLFLSLIVRQQQIDLGAGTEAGCGGLLELGGVHQGRLKAAAGQHLLFQLDLVEVKVREALLQREAVAGEEADVRVDPL